MPAVSRKKAKGRARKAAKAKKAASAPPKNFTEITLDSWLTLCDQEHENERCYHGCDLSMVPKSEHDCRDFAMQYARDFLSEICRMCESDMKIDVQKASRAKDYDLVGHCVQQSESFAAAIEDMDEKYPEVFDDPNAMKWAITFYHARGTQDVIDGNMKRAQHAAICAELLDWYLRFDDLADTKLHDMMQANDKAIYSYFRKRSACSCLDEKEKRRQYKGMKKMGVCCNDQCPLPGRVVERSSLLYCTGCKITHYCSAECQKVNWKHHKIQCASMAKLNSFGYAVKIAEDPVAQQT